MEIKEKLKLKNHILTYGSQDQIDKCFGKNIFENETIDVIKEMKYFGSFEFIGEYLINILATEELTKDNFHGGFNEKKHFFIINSPEDVEKFKDSLLKLKKEHEVTKKIIKDISSFLKEDFKKNNEIIQKVNEAIIKRTTLTRKEQYNLMTEILQYTANKKSLSELFEVGINYYRELEKEFKEENKWVWILILLIIKIKQ